MALVLKNLHSFYDRNFNEDQDPRIQNLFLLNSTLSVFILVSIYLFIVNGRGQRWMADRKPYDLKNIINVYNIFQVITNLYVFIMACYYQPQQNNFRLFCIPTPKNQFDHASNQIVILSYIYFMLKALDLMDTMFFILRKKNNQVSFLHIYHHSGMLVASFTYCKMYSGGGYGTVLGILNSFVHVVMYFYYFLTSYSPDVKKSLWWKKYITQLQLVQFVLLLVYCIATTFFAECPDAPKIFTWFGIIQSTIMIALFGDFYYKAYIKKKTSP